MLNDKQKEAVNFKDGAALVLAGAGCGKTKVLTERIVKLIDEGVNPYNILAITFTNKAAKEMRERVRNKIGDVCDNIFIGTFHSFGVKIIRENYNMLGFTKNINILDREDMKVLIKRILKDLGYNPADYEIGYIISKISFAKNEGLSPDAFGKLFLNDVDIVVAKVYERYLKVLRENNSVDFDDLLIMPVDLFKKNKDVLEKYSERYKYILVDEYQDTNKVQYDLCNLIASKYKNIFVVGDIDQSIYAWRNADYRNVLYFERDYKDVSVILLEENYRSTNTILKAANSVIKNNSQRKEKNLWSSFSDGDKIEYVRCDNEKEEASFVANKIKEFVELGYRYDDFAILYRTNAQSRSVEEGLLKANIPYKVIGSYYFYNRKEIKDLIAYLNLIYNKNDSVSLERVINTPKRGIGQKSVDAIREKAKIENISMFDAIDSGKELEWKNMIYDLIEYSKNSSLSDLIGYVLDKTGLKFEYEKDNSAESQIKLENLEEFRSVALEVESQGIYTLEEFLENIMLVSDKSEYKEDDNAVSAMTLHSAKGLEFRVVFLVGMEEGIFPHIRSFESSDELEEERRLCYVGITRAKEKLFILNAKVRMLFGRSETHVASRFIREIDSELINENTIKKEREVVNIVSNMYNETSEIKAGDLVSHAKFGDGIVIKVSGGLADIAFKHGVGVKTLAANHKSIVKR
ncbi:MAG: UvrD-helicase domain-containing protein [Bacilli bacterium]|nr:UvrD-helicase domain-containing protein [Bacilli bacterium]